MNESQRRFKEKAKAAGTYNRGNRAAQSMRYYSTRKIIRSAHNAVAKAAIKGIIIKPHICSACGAFTENIIGHHTDYTKPLDVTWVCWMCHNNLHSGGNEEVVSHEAL